MLLHAILTVPTSAPQAKKNYRCTTGPEEIILANKLSIFNIKKINENRDVPSSTVICQGTSPVLPPSNHPKGWSISPSCSQKHTNTLSCAELGSLVALCAHLLCFQVSSTPTWQHGQRSWGRRWLGTATQGWSCQLRRCQKSGMHPSYCHCPYTQQLWNYCSLCPFTQPTSKQNFSIWGGLKTEKKSRRESAHFASWITPRTKANSFLILSTIFLFLSFLLQLLFCNLPLVSLCKKRNQVRKKERWRMPIYIASYLQNRGGKMIGRGEGMEPWGFAFPKMTFFFLLFHDWKRYDRVRELLENLENIEKGDTCNYNHLENKRQMLKKNKPPIYRLWLLSKCFTKFESNLFTFSCELKHGFPIKFTNMHLKYSGAH